MMTVKKAKGAIELTFEKICDLAPSAENRRNSEGDFLLLKDGRILFVYSRYGAGDGDGDAADLYFTVSSDGGESFAPPLLLLSRASLGADNLMSVTLRRMKNGDVGLFFLKKTAPYQCRLYLARSSDEAKTFSPPVACIPHRGYFVVNNDRVILTREGRWLVPAALTEVLIDDETGEGSYGPAHMILYASDDDGVTWYKKSEVRPAGGFERSRTGLQEPGLAELADGTLWAWFRTDTGWQYESISHDGGEHWSSPVRSDFTSPASPASIKALSDGSLLAVWNPVPLFFGKSDRANGIWTGGRNPLTAARSFDGGFTFSAPFTLEDDPERGFAYTAIKELPDKSILLAYSAGGKEDGGMLNRLRIARLRI